MSLKDTWKETGTGLGHAFRDLGKAIGESAAAGVARAGEFVSKEAENVHNNTEDDVVADTTAKEVNK